MPTNRMPRPAQRTVRTTFQQTLHLRLCHPQILRRAGACHAGCRPAGNMAMRQEPVDMLSLASHGATVISTAPSYSTTHRSFSLSAGLLLLVLGLAAH